MGLGERAEPANEGRAASGGCRVAVWLIPGVWFDGQPAPERGLVEEVGLGQVVELGRLCEVGLAFGELATGPAEGGDEVPGEVAEDMACGEADDGGVADG